MVQVSTPTQNTVTNETPLTDWTTYTIRPAVKAKLFPTGAIVGSVTIPPGYWAVAFGNGTLRAVDPVTFEAAYAVP